MRLCSPLHGHFATWLCTCSALRRFRPRFRFWQPYGKSQAWLPPVPHASPIEPRGTHSVSRVGLKDPRLTLRRATPGSFSSERGSLHWRLGLNSPARGSLPSALGSFLVKRGSFGSAIGSFCVERSSPASRSGTAVLTASIHAPGNALHAYAAALF